MGRKRFCFQERFTPSLAGEKRAFWKRRIWEEEEKSGNAMENPAEFPATSSNDETAKESDAAKCNRTNGGYAEDISSEKIRAPSLSLSIQSEGSENDTNKIPQDGFAEEVAMSSVAIASNYMGKRLSIVVRGRQLLSSHALLGWALLPS